MKVKYQANLVGKWGNYLILSPNLVTNSIWGTSANIDRSVV